MPADPQSDIWADLEAGERPILLVDLRDDPCFASRHGRKADKSVPFRYRTRGMGGVRLEAARSPSGWFTTRPAVLRFYAALTGVRPQTVGHARRSRERHLAAADRELAAAGI